MKTVKTNGIENYNLVATYNADAFAVENEDLLAEVMEALGEYAERYDQEDDEFEDMAVKLDGDADTYDFILANADITVGILK